MLDEKLVEDFKVDVTSVTSPKPDYTACTEAKQFVKPFSTSVTHQTDLGLGIFTGWPTHMGHGYGLPRAWVQVGIFPPAKNLYLRGRLCGLVRFFFLDLHHRCRRPLTA